MYQPHIQYFTFSFVLNSLPIPQFRLLRLTAIGYAMCRDTPWRVPTTEKASKRVCPDTGCEYLECYISVNCIITLL
jgi:hypothetical protein